MTRPDAQRVVMTGIGVVSPVGTGREEMWRTVTAGISGAGPITLFDATGFDVQVACEVKGFTAADFMDRKASRRMDRYAQLAVAAARLALDDSGFVVDGDGAGIGAVIGNGGSGTISREEQHRIMVERGVERISPFAIPLSVANMGAGQVSIELGLRGPVMAVCTACASGTDSIGQAVDTIRRGDARAMLAGGADCLVSPYFVSGFDAMKVLTRRDGDPADAPRPFDRERDGFLVGEAGAVVVLEPLEAARARGAQIICEVTGYGSSNDGYHITEPDPTGAPQAAAIRAVMRDAGLGAGDIDHVNAHGGGSRPGDPSEVRVLREVLGDEEAARVTLTATKSMHGHCMGATGALEAAITALTIRHGVIPPNRNLHEVDPECAGVDHIARTARTADVRTALSTSYGLGGHNAVLALTRCEEA
ncbi:MAG: beta-ketoacyl-[acyl-carrier-protein] synthase family protein [Thermoleophilia bacterium]|jgi:3-oxoacyl-[acyl-carrier-protein] synthase II